jgi:hypothetical protein
MAAAVLGDVVPSSGMSGAGVAVGAGPLGQPLRIGPGLIGAGLHTSGQGLGEHERGGGLEFAAEQSAGPVASNPSLHQS